MYKTFGNLTNFFEEIGPAPHGEWPAIDPAGDKRGRLRKASMTGAPFGHPCRDRQPSTRPGTRGTACRVFTDAERRENDSFQYDNGPSLKERLVGPEEEIL